MDCVSAERNLILSVFLLPCPQRLGFPDNSVVKNLPANVGNMGLNPEWGSSPGEGNGNPLEYSCLGNTTDRGPWRSTVHGVTKELHMTLQLNSNNSPNP